MSTCKIEFAGLASAWGGAQIRMPTTQPAALTPHIPDVNWKTICDRINATLEPLNPITRRKNILSMIVFFTTFLLIATFIIYTTTTGSTIFDTGDNGIPTEFIIIFGWILGTNIILILLRCHHTRKVTLVMEDVKIILDDVSAHYTDLTFHLREERIYGRKNRSYLHRYIEVSIANVQGYVASPYEYSTSDRLGELERLKPLLTEDEYAEKRKEILDTGI